MWKKAGVLASWVRPSTTSHRARAATPCRIKRRRRSRLWTSLCTRPNCRTYCVRPNGSPRAFLMPVLVPLPQIGVLTAECALVFCRNLQGTHAHRLSFFGHRRRRVPSHAVVSFPHLRVQRGLHRAACTSAAGAPCEDGLLLSLQPWVLIRGGYVFSQIAAHGCQDP